MLYVEQATARDVLRDAEIAKVRSQNTEILTTLNNLPHQMGIAFSAAAGLINRPPTVVGVPQPAAAPDP